MRAIVSQRLVIGKTGKRLPALEIMIDTPRVKELIQRGEVGIIKEAMEQGAQEGSQTFDMALYELYTAGKIDLDQALSNADSVNNLRLKIKVAETKDAATEGKSETGAFRIEGAKSSQQRRFERL